MRGDETLHDWADYWNGRTTVYANDRHKRVHYEGIARDIIAMLSGPYARVVDYGCGDALSADRVADACRRLYLCDAARTVRERLAERFADHSQIEVISVGQFEMLPAGTADLIVANSVIQYLSRAQLERFLRVAWATLSPRGRLVLADVIPKGIGPLQDATELLKFAARNGFLLPAAVGLGRSFFSSYRRVRQQLGLLQFDEAEMLDLLARFGFEARRHYPNMGHNRRRMTFLASKGGT
jgi:SAM-dependent methyltransferase